MKIRKCYLSCPEATGAMFLVKMACPQGRYLLAQLGLLGKQTALAWAAWLLHLPLPWATREHCWPFLWLLQSSQLPHGAHPASKITLSLMRWDGIQGTKIDCCIQYLSTLLWARYLHASKCCFSWAHLHSSSCLMSSQDLILCGQDCMATFFKSQSLAYVASNFQLKCCKPQRSNSKCWISFCILGKDQGRGILPLSLGSH